jgi:hypothetical protein
MQGQIDRGLYRLAAIPVVPDIPPVRSEELTFMNLELNAFHFDTERSDFYTAY